jgi:hypothetical protein
MTRLIYCYPTTLLDPLFFARPSIARYSQSTNIYGYWVMPLDRTGTIKTPIRSVDLFPMPKFRPFAKSYEDICNDRAVEILRSAESMGITIYVLYSGGIDSTCLLVSLLKHATTEQKKHIVVLLSHESIAENPRFYDEHIRGKLRTGSSIMFPNLIGQNDMLLSAEHNDLVMGSEKIGKLMLDRGPHSIHEAYDRDTLFVFFTSLLGGDTISADFYLNLFERIRDASQIPINTNMEFLWWINFSIKWQACYFYILLFTPPERASLITKEYLDTRFISFYNTEEFQLWSMNNPDKRIRDTWKSYKWVIKDIIYDYTKDSEYRDNKTKVRSLPVVLEQLNIHFRYFDENAVFRNDLSPESFLEQKNDFI